MAGPRSGAPQVEQVLSLKGQSTEDARGALLLEPHWPECSHMAAPLQGMLGKVVFGCANTGSPVLPLLRQRKMGIFLTFSAMLIYPID